MIVCPIGIPTPRKVYGCRGDGLLMIHPFSYIKLLWGKERGITIKEFVFRHTPLAQSYYLPDPSFTIRIEWWRQDLKENNISAIIDEPKIPYVELCLSTSTYIRRVYKKDFDLGDYNESF